MRSASQFERAERLLNDELRRQVVAGWPRLFAARVPVFFRHFLVDITNDEIKGAFERFDIHARNQLEYRPATYGFDGLIRHAATTDVTLHRNGMLTLNAEIQGSSIPDAPNHFAFELARIDVLIRQFAARAQEFCTVANIDSPALLQVEILSSMHLHAEWHFGTEKASVAPNEDRRFVFPPMAIQGTYQDVDVTVRPICDYVHQMFGRPFSSWFGPAGVWRDPRNQ
jgi:hypothetical protein